MIRLSSRLFLLWVLILLIKNSIRFKLANFCYHTAIIQVKLTRCTLYRNWYKAAPMLIVVVVISAGSDFCKNRESGLYPDPDDCAGFIICNIGKAHRQKCAPPQLLRADTMNCDLPERVDCGTRPRRYDLAQGFYLTDTPQVHYNSYMKPAQGANRGKISHLFIDIQLRNI